MKVPESPDARLHTPLPPPILSALVRAAAHAPSGDNCQPWRFHSDGRCLRVRFVPERAESFYDVGNRASWISLGAVLENLEIAAASRGIGLRVELFPAAGHSDVVAVATPSPIPTVEARLADAIEKRCVNRRPYEPRALPRDVRTEIDSLVSAVPGAHLSWVEDAAPKAKLAALAAENDRLLFEHRGVHDGVYRWLRWTASESARAGDGMPVATLELSPIERPGFRLAAWWPFARALAAMGVTRAVVRRSRHVYERSAALVLLTVDGGAREDFVRGGRVMERIWLTATNRGLSFQPVTGITFLLLRLLYLNGDGLSAEHRRRLQRIGDDASVIVPRLRTTTPIMLFRIGNGAAPSARSPRLSLSQLLTTDVD